MTPKSLFLAFLLCLLFTPVSASAVEDNAQRFQAEAQDYAKTCQVNPLQSNRYHCSCLAAYIYDARLRRDYRDVSVILAEKGRNCFDTASIAGKALQQCQQFPRRDQSSQTDYCSCYAREMARLTQRFDDDSPIAQQKLMTMSLQRCQKLYPDRVR